MQTTTYKINNEDLQHSTESYIQCPVINYNGNESEATYLKLTQCCKSTVVKLKKKKKKLGLSSPLPPLPSGLSKPSWKM